MELAAQEHGRMVRTSPRASYKEDKDEEIGGIDVIAGVGVRIFEWH